MREHFWSNTVTICCQILGHAKNLKFIRRVWLISNNGKFFQVELNVKMWNFPIKEHDRAQKHRNEWKLNVFSDEERKVSISPLGIDCLHTKLPKVLKVGREWHEHFSHFHIITLFLIKEKMRQFYNATRFWAYFRAKAVFFKVEDQRPLSYSPFIHSRQKENRNFFFFIVK